MYRKLREERRAGERFSDAVARLLARKEHPLMKYAGAWKPLAPKEADAIRNRIERLRHGTPAR